MSSLLCRLLLGQDAFGRVYPISVFLLIHLSWQYERIPVKANPILGIPHLSPLPQAKVCSRHSLSFSAPRPVRWFCGRSECCSPPRPGTAVAWSSLGEITQGLLLPCSVSSDNTSLTEADRYSKYQSNQYKNFLVRFLTGKTAQDPNFPKTKISLCICQ